ncbi:MAG: tRNA (adenosine(37)-N6)-threonylcarbamoyltransferase complex ATPase subunit type 1 TsaE [Prevotella sp.]|nr:tRNA (adenosine(37)-N6)-threonylcarbamoyltransferase complex ATPase subunit type 1 TsaE [Prevotella sp.]
MEIIIENIDQIRTAAREFIEKALPEHSVIAFYGGMGAGKTTFIKALCEELGVEDTVTSPTFALVNEYSINEELRIKNEEFLTKTDSSLFTLRSSLSKVFHFDFYRIKRLEEVYDMGYEDYFYQKNALCLIEWPELVEELLPDDALRVEISEQPDGTRKLKVKN